MIRPIYADLEKQVWAEFAVRLVMPETWLPIAEEFLAELDIFLIVGECDDT